MHDPFLRTLKIIGRHGHFLLVEKGDIDQRSVGRRRARCLAVELVFFFERRLEDDFLPEDPAGVAIETKQHALFAFGQTGDGEQFVLPHNWGRMARAGNFRSPGDVARRGPMHRRFFCKARAIAARPPPTGPIFRPCFRTERDDCDERRNEPQSGLGGRRGKNCHAISSSQSPRPVSRSPAGARAGSNKPPCNQKCGSTSVDAG